MASLTGWSALSLKTFIGTISIAVIALGLRISLLASVARFAIAMFYFVTGMRLKTGSQRLRNTLYVLPLGYFALEMNGAESTLERLPLLSSFAISENVAPILFLLICFLWLSYGVARFFDAAEAAQGDLPDPSGLTAHALLFVLTCGLATLANTLLPAILSMALVASLEIDPAAQLREFGGFVLQKTSEADILLIDQSLDQLTVSFERWFGLPVP